MNIEKDFSIEDKVQLARENFLAGHNCAQSVFMAYADIINLDQQTAARLSVSFGGGMGRMREVCGVVSAMFMLTGFKYEVTDQNSLEQRKENYAQVQALAKKFSDLHGNIICRELLKSLEVKDTNPEPSVRTNEYYTKRPCCRFVTTAAFLVGKMLKEEEV